MRLSQYELGQKIGVSRKTIYKWETDQAKPTKANLREMEKLFNVSLSEGYRDVIEWDTDQWTVAQGEGKACKPRRLKAEYEYLKNRMLQLKNEMADVKAQPV